jgi:type I restriction enzyme S subunit
MVGETALSGKYTAYAQYKDSGEEWLGKVPTHWDVIQIKHLSAVKRGASPRPIDDAKYFDEDGEYAWTRIADVTASDVYLMKAPQRLSSLGSSLSVKLEPESLFLSIAGTVGKPCITGMKACIHDGFVYFPELKIPSKFLFYVFAGEQAYKGLGKFGTQLNLNTDTVGGIKIGCATIEELEEIVHFLDHETAKIDTLIDKQQQLITLLKEKRQAVISHAVTKGLKPNAPMRDSGVEWLGEVPEHWDVKRVKHFGKIIGGYAFKSSDFVDFGVRAVKISNVSHLSFDWSDSSYLPSSFLTNQRDYIPPKNSLFFAMTRPIISGGVKVAKFDLEEECLVNQRVGFLKPSPDINQDYLMYVAQSKSFFCAFENNCTVTNQPNISAEGIEDIRFACADLVEQQEIVSYIKRVSTLIGDTVNKSESQVELLKERRTALISAAVTGKVDVRHWQAPVTTNGKEVNP